MQSAAANASSLEKSYARLGVAGEGEREHDGDALHDGHS